MTSPTQEPAAAAKAHGGNRGILVATVLATLLALLWEYVGARRLCASEPGLSYAVFGSLGWLVAGITSGSLTARAKGEVVPWPTRVGDAMVAVEWTAVFVLIANLLLPFASGQFLLLWLAVMASAAVLGGLVAAPAMSFLVGCNLGPVRPFALVLSPTERVPGGELRFVVRALLHTLLLVGLALVTVAWWIVGVGVVAALALFVLVSLFTDDGQGPSTQRVRKAKRRLRTTERQGSGVIGTAMVGPWVADTREEPAVPDEWVPRPLGPMVQWALLVFVLTLVIGLGAANHFLRGGGGKVICRANAGPRPAARIAAVADDDDHDDDDHDDDDHDDDDADEEAGDESDDDGDHQDDIPTRRPAADDPDEPEDDELEPDELQPEDDEVDDRGGDDDPRAAEAGYALVDEAAAPDEAVAPEEAAADAATAGPTALERVPIAVVPSAGTASVAFAGVKPAAPTADGGGTLEPTELTATTSSTANPIRSKGIRYDAGRAVDGQTDTWWQESSAGDGVGETLRLEWKRPARVALLRLVPGYMKKRADRWGDRWPVNNRLRRVTVRVDTGQSWDLELTDQRGWHDVRLSPPPLASWVEIEVRSVYPGKHPKTGARIEDTGVSEAQVWLEP